MRRYRVIASRCLARLLCVGWIASLLASGCGQLRGPIVTPEPTLLRIAGSTEMVPLLTELAAAYNTSHPNVTLDLQASGTRLGQESLEEGRVALAASSWYQPPGQETPSPLVGTPIAWDGLAIIVHPSNHVTDLTLSQLQSLYEGRILTWQDIGGSKDDILLVSREDGSGSRDAFESIVMKDQRTSLTAIIMPSAQAMVDYISTHPTAIGYASMGLVTDTVKILSIEGERPSPATVRNNQYPLSRVFYLLSQGPPSATAADFAGFAVSPAGQAIVGRHYGRVR